MNSMPTDKAIDFWMKQNGHKPAEPPAAFFTPDGEPRKIERKVEPSPEALAAAKPVDYAEIIRLRNELGLNMANSMRRAYGTITGPDHVALDDHEQFVPRLPHGIGEELLLDFFAE